MIEGEIIISFFFFLFSPSFFLFSFLFSFPFNLLRPRVCFYIFYCSGGVFEARKRNKAKPCCVVGKRKGLGEREREGKGRDGRGGG